MPSAPSLVLLRTQARESVGHIEAQLVCTLNDLLALFRTDVVCDFNSILLVVHQQHLEIRRALDEELVEAVFQAEAGLLVGAVADVRHDRAALEFPADAAVDAPWLPPRRIHPLEAVGLEPGELLHAL
eukprot:CAMPEP_0115620982 /NCGR_PEP_ID=MMETSP0272-20121206/25493_1 /TAXON_ID=71861 /ORGANISM="Scrippsiella trochoidea, Strain CCMP3099" /LENGTH=127 /DNA_ID=CAMNT_0003057091 /DNA_START=52 /DNA_END=432 /DNA_ORIENTATION=-